GAEPPGDCRQVAALAVGHIHAERLRPLAQGQVVVALRCCLAPLPADQRVFRLGWGDSPHPGLEEDRALAVLPTPPLDRDPTDRAGHDLLTGHYVRVVVGGDPDVPHAWAHAEL